PGVVDIAGEDLVPVLGGALHGGGDQSGLGVNGFERFQQVAFGGGGEPCAVRGFAFLVNEVGIGTIADESAVGDEFVEDGAIRVVSFDHVGPLGARHLPLRDVGVNGWLGFCRGLRL